MIKKRKFIDGFSMKVLAFIGYLALSSCGDSNNAFLENEEPIPVQLSISLADNGYSSDGEFIPMNTRADEQEYMVTRILFSTLIIMKEVDSNWVVEDIREDVIQQPLNNLGLLKKGEKLSLTENAKNFILLPGKYHFVLYLNSSSNSDIKIGDVVSKNSTQPITDLFTPYSDFYFAQRIVEIDKKGNLNAQNDNIVLLDLVRNSALVRFILVGNGWSRVNDPNITCQLSGETCVGMDILGNPIIENWDMISGQDLGVEIRRFTNYMNNGDLLFFSSAGRGRDNLSLFAIDEQLRTVKLIITSIGNRGDYSFEGTHELNIPVRKNYITTILIRKGATSDQIVTELDPDISQNWSDEYPPLDYIELNN